MLTLLATGHFTLPIEDPLLKFLIILIIILAAPLLLNKIKVPHLIGLIIAGALIGPNGLNVLPRDSSVVVIGTTGLLFIMFMAGLEIDLTEFKKNKWKSLAFGLITFSIPIGLGLLAGHYVLSYSWITAILFASIFSSHTLISYPILSKLGIAKNKAVNMTVGGTMITDILALLVLAVCVGMSQGEVTSSFWIRLSISLIIFGVIVLGGFPIVARWFFKKVDDKISHFIFVMVMIYLAGLFAELAGVEAIIGAFLAGLALNRLIPHSSTLMNRIDFVGNAIFIPFFLISVGMIIDFRAFIKDFETIKVALIMTSLAIGGKYLAAVLTGKIFKFRNEEGKLIFGLSTASAAATLAAVMVGYNVIIGETETGQPIRLLSESVLNGSILLILISCTVSSFVTQNAAEKIVELDNDSDIAEESDSKERILLALNYPSTVDPMTNLALLAKSKNATEKLFALNVINEKSGDSSEKNAEKLLEQSQQISLAAEVPLETLKRHDTDIINGINNEIKEHKISDLIIGIDPQKGFSSSFIYNLFNGYLNNPATSVLVYHNVQPISTIHTYHVVIPKNAHQEPGFIKALLRVWNIARNSGSKMIFYSSEQIITILERIKKKANIETDFIVFTNWRELTKVGEGMKANEGIILFLAKRGQVSYTPQMHMIPEFLNKIVHERNYLLIYPFSESQAAGSPTVYTGRHQNLEDYKDFGNLIGKLFK